MAVEQKHIPSRNLKGVVKLNKESIADIADLIRLSPTSCRVLLLLMAYSDDKNNVITNIGTIAKLIGVDIKKAKYCIVTLIENGYIEATNIKIKHENDIFGVSHDKSLYKKSNKQIWKVTGDKYITTFKITGEYNRFHINSNIVKCSNNQEGNILTHINGNLFYDNRISNNEIIWEM